MKNLFVKTSKPYDVKIGAGEINNLADYIKQVKNCNKIAIITDDVVGGLYGKKIKDILCDYDVCYHEFLHGEGHKTMDTVSSLLEFLAQNKLTRSDLVVALGGGIAGDVAGFVSASFLRGIDFVQIPTTLLSMVDSSVGGKTGVNLSCGKNLAGAFHQPCLVVCDPDFLATLPDEEFKNGLGEVIKYGCISDKNLFDLLATQDVHANLEEVIYTCIKIKADFVEQDEFDKGERQKLNFGHTLGHAVEKVTDFKIPHGQAVGVGMKLICQWAENQNLTAKGCADKIDGMLAKYNMVRDVNCDKKLLWQTVTNDKKLKGKQIDLVLIKDIADCILYRTNIDDLTK
ncbi:MAG: 3-dehydroquinate synthase [Clostridia bacterium]|nr:3-dehydroquinate synthase [Clostridia bacterium]